MWKIKHSKKDHIEHSLFVGTEFVVGRKDADLLLDKDPSVSRQHAVLVVRHPETNVGDASKPSSLFMRDSGSKYGTFCNGIRISSETQLHEGDTVKFGQFESEFRVCFTPLIATTSCLEVSAKRDLRKVIQTLGGHVVSEWLPSCTHLVMSEIKVTVKAVCCLVSAKPIVTPEFFHQLFFLKNMSLASNKHIPPLGEPLMDKEQVSFDVNLERKKLFQGRTFYFLDEKQYKKLHIGVVLGGGIAKLLSLAEIDVDLLSRDGTSVIEPAKEILSSQDMLDGVLQDFIAVFEKKNLRMIPESDIGLAVAYCSTEKYCNPKFHTGEVFRSQKTFIASQTFSQREVVAPDTPEQSSRMERSKVANEISSLQLSTLQPEQVVSKAAGGIKKELDDIFADITTSPVSKSLSSQQIFKSTTLQSVESPKPRSPSPPKAIKAPFRRSPSPSPVRSSKRLKVSRKSTSPEPESPIRQVPSPKKSSPVKTSTRMSRNKKNTEEAMDFIRTLDKVKMEPECESKFVHTKKQNGNKTKNGDSFDSDNENGGNDEVAVEAELPRNLVKIEYASLICKRPAPVVQNEIDSSKKNFKKFRKVPSKRARILPRIIGAEELVRFDKIATALLNEDWDEPEEVAVAPKKGEFDW